MKSPANTASSNPSAESHGAATLSNYQKERRRLLGMMAATAALAGAGCSAPDERYLVPYAMGPEQLLPGVPVLYATALAERGYGIGALVETNDGRPTKVEGNPRHPASLGSTTPQMQASVLQLWDPARSSVPLHRGQIGLWPQLQTAIESQRDALEKSAGAGLHILMRPSSSPLLASQLDRIRERYPRMQIAVYDPLASDSPASGARLAFGRALEPIYHFDRARVVLTLDADFLQGQPGSVRYARELVSQRIPDRGADMSRLYAIESTPGLIGALADHRLAARPDQIEALAYRLAHAFAIPAPAALAPSAAMRWEQGLLADLRAHRGACLVIPGDGMPPAVHALAYALNEQLGTPGTTHAYLEPFGYQPTSSSGSLDSLRRLTEAAAAGAVQLLLIIDGNPVYDAPVDLQFAAALARVPQSLHLSAYVDETSTACTWHVPATHAFEQWGDLRADDGTVSVVQPLIAPLYGGHSAHELLDLLTPLQASEAHAQLQALWRARGGADFDASWREWLRAGLIDGTAAPAASARLQLATLPAPQGTASAQSVPTASPVATQSAPASRAVQLIFIADQSIRDGQWSNNAWLQELPRSMSKLTWGNAAYVSPRTAAALGVQTGDEIWLEQQTGGASARPVRAGVWVLPQQPDECITLPLGYGRTSAGPVGDGVGFDAYPLRLAAAPWYGQALARRAGTRWSPALTQRDLTLHGRDELLPLATLQHFRREPHFATASEEERVPDHTLYPPYPYPGYKWAMTIDLNACIGCNACTIACQAENNIPTVGAEQVRLGRVMHWLRIDRYEDERLEAVDPLDPAGTARTRTLFQPVPCMQCENAPCEEVCPVEATVHDSQGLNVQVYNRCIGTRFCSNNCPYKVRRFNFLQYSNQSVDALKALQNPDVSVRRRGVMEKCTYCLQRIERARIAAELEHRGVRDGEVVTACQAACPTQAIRFGNLNDPQAQVRTTKASPRNYSLLGQLNTRPRTTYLARVLNPAEPERG
ncbi:MAG TPA: 4Fe-4S dicluster domain-containing protein [Steroidobacteraceae bacterium]|nr:4Fe-4S dicluster domain-containing protein [Steroidobacteraceae bacterium]